MRLILASRSAARIGLLQEAGVAFETTDPGVDEAALKARLLAEAASPAKVATGLAIAKAVRPRGVDVRVIGADQTLELDGRLFDKPRDQVEARTQLLMLRGRSHRLHSAVAVAENGVLVWRTVKSATLAVRQFSNGFLEDYLRREGDAVLGCVGAYRLERAGAQLFEHIEGDYFTILGLPLLELLAFLRGAGALPA